MRVPLQWLADYVGIDLEVHELARRLTMGGLKVEAVEEIGADWQDVVVGQVVELEAHPSSKKPLTITQVDLGDRRIQVVTGARNVSLGDKVPVVLVGGTLPHGPDGEPMTILSRPMAGVESNGMLASQRELGISEEHEGIFILPPDAQVGSPLRDVVGDDVLDIETHPNRPDTLSMIGVAREVAAITQQQVTLPDVYRGDANVQLVDEAGVDVNVAAPDLCPRYTAVRIDGVEVVGSPPWLATRLEAAGMRPINLLVDITNYVMLEYGQPLHAFDARQLSGDEIIVRRAGPEERIKTLDGVERVMSPDDLLIADASRAVGVAGVMGGENTEVRDDTTSIVLEAATFDAISVRRTAKRLGLRSEASSRFEKGLSPEQAELGSKRYVQLLAQITGKPLRVYRMTDRWPHRREPRLVRMPMRDLHRLIGLDISMDDAIDSLALLGFGVQADGDAVVVDVPYWRRADIQRSADVVEEVARLVGYERVPSTLPRRTLPPGSVPRELRLESVIRGRLFAMGVSETVTSTLTSQAGLKRLSAALNGHENEDAHSHLSLLVKEQTGPQTLELLNPPSTERNVLPTTRLPSLLDIAARNLKHGDEGLAFFDISRTFFPSGSGLPVERRTLSLALTGTRMPRGWQHPEPGPYTFYDIKGMVTNILLEVTGKTGAVKRAHHPALHPGRSASLELGDREIGVFGELHPLVANRFEIEQWPVQVAEIDLAVLETFGDPDKSYEPLPRFPSANRDLAVLVRRDEPAQRIVDIVRSTGGALLTSVNIFDVYEGESLPDGMKSVAVGLQFRSPTSTLRQETVTDLMNGIVAALRDELGASLRE